MISLDKLRILTPLQKLLKNVEDLGKIIVTKFFKKLPKVQKIAKSGHTATYIPIVPIVLGVFYTIKLPILFIDKWSI